MQRKSGTSAKSIQQQMAGAEAVYVPGGSAEMAPDAAGKGARVKAVEEEEEEMGEAGPVLTPEEWKAKAGELYKVFACVCGSGLCLASVCVCGVYTLRCYTKNNILYTSFQNAPLLDGMIQLPVVLYCSELCLASPAFCLDQSCLHRATRRGNARRHGSSSSKQEASTVVRRSCMSVLIVPLCDFV